MPSKYLIQKATGRLYTYTDALAARADMSPYDPETAQRRIDAARLRLENLKAEKVEVPNKMDEATAQAHQDARTLADLEMNIKDEEKRILIETTGQDPDDDTVKKTDEEIETDRQQKLIDEDPELSKISAMTKKEEVKAHALEGYGQEIDGSLKEMKAIVKDLRTKRLLEK